MILSKLASALIVAMVAVSHVAAQAPPDLARFLGNWTIALESPQGALTLNLSLKEENGKLRGSIHSDTVPEPQDITDITKSGDSLVLRYTRSLQGQAIPVKLTMTPDGDKTKVAFELAELATLAGTGTKK